MCTTSGAVCGGYKRMLEREKRYTEPAGKKEWSDGGQKNVLFLPKKIGYGKQPLSPVGLRPAGTSFS